MLLKKQSCGGEKKILLQSADPNIALGAKTEYNKTAQQDETKIGPWFAYRIS